MENYTASKESTNELGRAGGLTSVPDHKHNWLRGATKHTHGRMEDCWLTLLGGDLKICFFFLFVCVLRNLVWNIQEWMIRILMVKRQCFSVCIHWEASCRTASLLGGCEKTKRKKKMNTTKQTKKMTQAYINTTWNKKVWYKRNNSTLTGRKWRNLRLTTHSFTELGTHTQTHLSTLLDTHTCTHNLINSWVTLQKQNLVGDNVRWSMQFNG